MNCELKELSQSLINDDLYNMYQDIPNENGQTNEAYGIDYDSFCEFVNQQIDRKYNEITFDDTPTVTYIFYVEEKPVGYLGLRTKIDEKWLKWSGNFYYQIRKSERRKGYATKMLQLGLLEFKKMNFEVVYGQSSKDNVGSQKTIEKNGGIFLYEENGTHYYKIELL